MAPESRRSRRCGWRRRCRKTRWCWRCRLENPAVQVALENLAAPVALARQRAAVPVRQVVAALVSQVGAPQKEAQTRSVAISPQGGGGGGGAFAGGSGGSAKAASSRGGSSMKGGGGAKAAVVAAKKAAVVAAKKAAVVDAVDEQTVDRGRSNEKKIKHHDFVENSHGCDPYVGLRSSRLAFSASDQNRCGRDTQVKQKEFDTPQQAADGLVQAAESFDVPVLKEILGPDSTDLVSSQDPVEDKNRAAAFAAKAKEKNSVAADTKSPNRAVSRLETTISLSRFQS